ncbi:MAG: hypothetical protein M5U34_05695 [Chloroflexi bacterium]|nr:hypothetical protein [Chloroflexota bacterium]
MGQESAIVRSYMAHHQGMIMLALVNYLQDDKMVRRFHAEPTVQSVELLLQEQIPAAPTLQNPHEDGIKTAEAAHTPSITADPWSVPVDTMLPQVHYLANGRLEIFAHQRGGGMVQTSDMFLTRWRPDTTQDDWGLWLYLQDMDSGAVWSATRQPWGGAGQESSVQFFPIWWNTTRSNRASPCKRPLPWRHLLIWRFDA